MAQKRMFSKHITNDERFIEMPPSSQALYFHLGMNADDDGFVQPKMIMRMVGAKDDDLRVLGAKGFVLEIPNTENVVVITHWKVNNTLKSDRYKPSFYSQHREMLGIADNMTYIPKWNQNGTLPEPQVRLGKVSIGEDSINSSPSGSHTIIKNIDKKDEVAYAKQHPQDTPQDCVFPPQLDTPAFREAWADWVQHRKEIKKKLTPLSIKQQLKNLADIGADNAVAAIKKSIANGWTGVFIDAKTVKVSAPRREEY